MGPSWKTNELWASYMAGLERACRERHFHLVLHMGDSAATPEEIAVDLSRRAAGVLLKVTERPPAYVELLARQLPIVGFGGYNPFCRIPQVSQDNRAAGMVAAERLLQRGHRRIAFVNHELHNLHFVGRSQGYTEFMKYRGLFVPELLLENGPAVRPQLRNEPQATPPDMTAILDQLLALPERPTAVILANDWAAYGFYKACQVRKVRIPDDFSVVGFDDVGTLCEALSPALSSVALPFGDVAYFAACNLFDLIGGAAGHTRNLASVQYLPGELHESAFRRYCEKNDMTFVSVIR
jgi:LacI family transcriptional regulator